MYRVFRLIEIEENEYLDDDNHIRLNKHFYLRNFLEEYPQTDDGLIAAIKDVDWFKKLYKDTPVDLFIVMTE